MTAQAIKLAKQEAEKNNNTNSVGIGDKASGYSPQPQMTGYSNNR